jgi:hypothetical protein
MPIKVTCPKCQGVLHAPDDAGGKRGKCPTCGTVLAIPAETPVPAEVPVPAPPPVEAPQPAETRRSAFGMMPEPEPRKASAGRLPPPAFTPPEPRKLPDPFARPGKPAINTGPGDGLIRAWRRTRRGLGWVRLALFFYLLPFLGLAGIAIAENYGKPLPDKTPGYLKIEELSSATEIRAAVAVVPVALGLLCMLIGRFGTSNAPRTSYAKGLATAAAVGTLLVTLGLVAAAVPVAGQLANGFVPRDLMLPDDINGVVQRIGLMIAGVFAPLAELWFVVALGRMGAALHNDRLAARGTKFLIYVGLVLVVGAFLWSANFFYPQQVREAVTDYVQPNWDKLGAHKPTAQAAVVALAALVVWFWYARLVGGGRRAIREWLEHNEPVG